MRQSITDEMGVAKRIRYLIPHSRVLAAISTLGKAGIKEEFKDSLCLLRLTPSPVLFIFYMHIHASCSVFNVHMCACVPTQDTLMCFQQS